VILETLDIRRCRVGLVFLLGLVVRLNPDILQSLAIPECQEFLGYQLHLVFLEILDNHLNLDNHHYQVYLQSPDIPHCRDILKDTQMLSYRRAGFFYWFVPELF
jgi:hypothetical protein